MRYDTIIVGGGIAGLTAAAFLSKNGYKVLLCEKENKVGGLVNSFNYKGFIFDGGIRAMEDSGIVTPMLKSLGLDVEFINNTVSIGIEDRIIKVTSKESLLDYKELLCYKFPESVGEIENIIDEINRITEYMDLLYSIENPLFIDFKENKDYLINKMVPWSFKFIPKLKKIDKLNIPVVEYLRKFTSNEALIDMIAQHFFEESPAFFALGYFSLYLEYKYPKGGTGTVINKIKSFILEHNGDIKTEVEIKKISTEAKCLTDTKGNEYNYNKLIWAADISSLYNNIDIDSIKNKKIKSLVEEKKKLIKDKKGGDSILSLYLTVNLDKSYFEEICTEHFFYTPIKKGLASLKPKKLQINSTDKEKIVQWLISFLELTTYEIAIPAMRDETLVPKGKTGLIISTFFDYEIVETISNLGWYEEFKNIAKETIINTLENSIFRGIQDKVIDGFVSTPLTIKKISGNKDGAITGWAFTNSIIPSEYKMVRLVKSVDTVIPDVFQAGQWTFSPAGFPISILTGKLAANKVIKSK